MFNSPTRPGFSKVPRPMFNLGKDKMSAPNNAYYVLTQAHVGLPNSVLFSDQSHTILQDIGTNTHAEIDTHIANTSNPHSTALDDIENPAGDTTFTFAANKHLHFIWTGAAVGDDGQFEIEGLGGWRGDLIHVHQHTGAIPVAADLLHLEAESANVTNIRLNNTTNTNVFEVGPLGSPVMSITNLGVATLANTSAMATSAAPTLDAQIANKKYVDDNAGGLWEEVFHDGRTWAQLITSRDIDMQNKFIQAERFNAPAIYMTDNGIWTTPEVNMHIITAEELHFGADSFYFDDTLYMDSDIYMGSSYIYFDDSSPIWISAANAEGYFRIAEEDGGEGVLIATHNGVRLFFVGTAS